MDYLPPIRQLNLLVQDLKGVSCEAGLGACCVSACLGTQLGICWEQFHFHTCFLMSIAEPEVFLEASLECWEQRAEGSTFIHPSIQWLFSAYPYPCVFWGYTRQPQILSLWTDSGTELLPIQLMWEGRRPCCLRHTYVVSQLSAVDIIRDCIHTHIHL